MAQKRGIETCSLQYRRLSRESSADERAFQHILETVPGYQARVTGKRTIPKTQARENLDALPPGCRYAQKEIWIFAGERGADVGACDLVFGFPDAETLMLGLLLVDEKAQGTGLGRAAYALIEDAARARPEIARIRIGVVDTNPQALGFWRKMKFRETGETRPHEIDGFRATTIVLEKRLSRD